MATVRSKPQPQVRARECATHQNMKEGQRGRQGARMKLEEPPRLSMLKNLYLILGSWGAMGGV